MGFPELQTMYETKGKAPVELVAGDTYLEQISALDFVLNQVNGLDDHPTLLWIQFTMQAGETGPKLIDTLVKKNDGRLRAELFYITTYTHRYLEDNPCLPSSIDTIILTA